MREKRGWRNPNALSPSFKTPTPSSQRISKAKSSMNDDTLQPWIEEHCIPPSEAEHWCVVVPLPTCFAALSQREGLLDNVAVWRTYAEGIGLSTINERYAEYMRVTEICKPVSRHTSSAARQRTKEVWKRHVVQLDLPSAASVQSGMEGMLERELKELIRTHLEPVLLALSATSQSVLKLTAPRRTFYHFLYPLRNDATHGIAVDQIFLRWISYEHLKPILYRTCIPMANILCDLYAKTQSEVDYVVCIVQGEEDGLLEQFPDLHAEKSCGADFYVVTGKLLRYYMSIVRH